MVCCQIEKLSSMTVSSVEHFEVILLSERSQQHESQASAIYETVFVYPLNQTVKNIFWPFRLKYLFGSVNDIMADL